MGVTLDQRLNFKTHIKERNSIGLKAHSLLKTYFRSTLSLTIKIRLYLAIFRPMIMYGQELFHSGINIEKIETFWIRYMEKMWVENRLQLYSRIPIVPVDTYMKERRKRYMDSAKTKKFIQDNLPNQINDRIIKHKITYQELLTH